MAGRTKASTGKHGDNAKGQGVPHPRSHGLLFGHDEAALALETAIASGQMHHAWMLTGPRGIGKATLAYRAARRLLRAEPGEHAVDHTVEQNGGQAAGGPLASVRDDPVWSRIAAGSHGDLLVLEKPQDARGVEKAEIPAELARKTAAFFARTSGEGGRQVCIIDAADEMTVQGVNAILKTLEEPPPGAVFLLIAHAPGKMPPTIASRCRRLVMRAPGVEAAVQAVMTHCGVSEDEARHAAAASEGRPGEAVRYVHAGGQRLATQLDHVLGASDPAGLAGLAESLGGRDKASDRQFALSYVRARLRQVCRQGGPIWRGQALDAVAEIDALEGDIARLKTDPKLAMRQIFSLAQGALGKRG